MQKTYEVLDSNTLNLMISEGAIPLIEKEINAYKNGEESLYGTIYSIGLICDTYHSALHTGNTVKCAKNAVPPKE